MIDSLFIRWRRTVAVAVCIAPLISGLWGCTINPATGERQLTLIGEQQEIAMGRQAHQDIVASFGLYEDEALQSYVGRIGTALAAESERPDLPWQFHVVDDPVVNAFALPGGFIYLTRGMLAHFNSEAEMASVLGHEIGHVTGRHSVEQMSQAQLANLGFGIAMIASEDLRPYAGVASTGLQLLFLKFSRDDEREADTLGLRYLSRGGYRPDEMADVFVTLARVSEAQGGGRIPVWASTHPAPEERARRVEERVSEMSPDRRGGAVEQAEYLQRLDNLVYGEDPRQGYTVGRTYYHPEMRFKMTFPESWRVINQRQAVVSVSPDEDAAVVLTLAAENDPAAAQRAFFGSSAVEHLGSWRGFQRFRTVPTQEQPTSLHGLVEFREHGGRIFRLLAYTSEDRWSAYDRPFAGAVSSFGSLGDRRYLDVEPKRVRLVRIDRAMTLSVFDRRHPSTIDLGELAILNGVEADQTLEAGRIVKRVIGGELPES